MNKHLLITAMTATSILASASSAFAGTVPGNPSCADLGYGAKELKIEPVKSGQYTDGDLTVDITVNDVLFDWTASEGIDAIIVKGGDNAEATVFDPEALSGNGFHAPDNGGKWYGLSHISFCYDEGGDTTPDPGTPDDPTPPQTPETPETPQTPETPTPPAPPAPVVTPPAPQQEVLGSTAQSPGSAKLAKKGGCKAKYFRAKVTGKRIASVKWTLDRRALKSGRSVKIAMKRLFVGVHRLEAKVTFTAASGTKTKTLRANFSRCARQVIQPTFTG